jgi:putative flavoprotein involved in K+ transport
MTLDRPKTGASCPRPTRTRPARIERCVLVIGAGPAGLAAAACLKEQGIAVDLVDRIGKPAGAYGRLDGGITLSSPAVFTQLPGLPIEAATQYITIAQYREYLFRYAEHFGLKPAQRTVESIERTGPRFAVRFAGDRRTWIYQAVVTATGMCDYPVMASIDGLGRDAKPTTDGVRVMHSYHWPGQAAMADKRILIVGGASSAIAIAEQCAAAGTAVTLSTRHQRMRFSWTRVLGIDLRRWTYPLTRRLPRWMFGQRCSLRPSFPGTEKGFRKFKQTGVIAVRGQVQRFEGNDAIFADGSRQPFDVVVLATGYRFNMPFLPAEVARASGGQPLADRGESRSWTGLYFIGIPCGRTVASEFLHGMAADAPQIARRISERLRTIAATRATHA